MSEDKVYLVATIKHSRAIGSSFMFSDIILVTRDEKEANSIKDVVKNKMTYPGLDYSLLAAYDDVMYFEREIGSVIQHSDSTLGAASIWNEDGKCIGDIKKENRVEEEREYNGEAIPNEDVPSNDSRESPKELL